MNTKKLQMSLATVVLLSASVAQATPWDRITLNGYMSFEYERVLTDPDKAVKEDPHGSFDADLFDIVLNIQATDNLRIATDITFEHGAQTENNRGNVALEYAFAEYTFTDLMKVRVGKQFSAFGIYNEIHTAKPATIQVKEPRATNKPGKLTDSDLEGIRYFPRWNTGIALTGNGESFDYILQLANGDQEEVDADTNPYEADNNSQKSVTARYRYYVSDDLRIGASGYVDKITGGGDDFTIDQTIDVLSFGLQANWELETVVLELEGVWGSVDLEGSVLPSDDEKVDRYGIEFLAGYYVTDELLPYVELEYFEPNTDVSDDNVFIGIVGINYELDTNLFLKAEVDYINAGDNNSLYGTAGNNGGDDVVEFKAAVAIGF